MGTIARLANHRESRFYTRLKACAENQSGFDLDQVSHLIASVDHVVAECTAIAKLVVRDMPHYTLHDETHLLNVLTIMAALVPEETMKQLSPLECALCIMAAYTHDLGMVLPDTERQQMTQPGTEEYVAYQGFRSGYASLVQRVEHLTKQEQEEKDAKRKATILAEVTAIEGYILAENIRQGHTALYGRVSTWLDRIAGERSEVFCCPLSGDFRDRLSLFATSHGRDANWLRHELVGADGNPDGFVEMVGNHGVNWTFPGLLLRLADIQDMDWTRAPRLLFENLGLEEWRKAPAAVRGARQTSWEEWSKHTSIIGWQFLDGQEGRTFRFDAKCWTPIVHKTLLDFSVKINAELASVRAELDRQRRQVQPELWHYDLPLPETVDFRVKPHQIKGKPVYQYTPIQFALDQHEILQLLMGTSLYGDPSLCIRELLQNALDATQMRDLRLKLPRDRRRVLTDPLEDGEKLEVTLIWGKDEDSGQSFIEVTDNGIGMTPADLQKYFTQVGKSYYRSHEFEQEREAFRQAGQQCSPISIFGIGILSCFMIADRIRVRTRPGGWRQGDTDPEHARTDFSISGPGSLFWMNEGTLDHQGTEVRIYLKPEFTLCHDPEAMWRVLRIEFDPSDNVEDRLHKPNYPAGERTVDPALVAIRYCVWPTCPVRIRPPEAAVIVLDDQLHACYLAEINQEKLLEKAKEWDFPPEAIGSGVQWSWWDWVDKGGSGTGSRIRLWYPSHDGRQSPAFPVDVGNKDLLRLSDLAALTEAQFSSSTKPNVRLRWLIRGMVVPDIEAIRSVARVIPHAGSRLWVDLQGEAAPAVKADRKGIVRELSAIFFMRVQDMFGRFAKALAKEAGICVAIWRNIRAGYLGDDKLVLPVFDEQPLLGDIGEDKSFGLGGVATWIIAQLELDRGRSFSSDHASARTANTCDFIRDPTSRMLPPSSALVRASKYTHVLDQARTLALVSTHALATSFDPILLNPILTNALANVLGRTPFLSMFCVHVHSRERMPNPWQDALCCHHLSEAAQPSLERSLPALEWFWLKGKATDLHLLGPTVFSADRERDGRTVHGSPTTPWLHGTVADFGYDLVFPFTAIPLADLRQKAWDNFHEHRFLRAFVTLPFFSPGTAPQFREQATALQPLFALFPVDRVHVLMPRQELWDKAFKDWTEEEWRTCGISGLWDIKEGWVKWLPGPAKADDIAEKGVPLEELEDPWGKKTAPSTGSCGDQSAPSGR